MNVIADFIGQIVPVFYGLTGNYGIAIVMITLSIKLLLLPMNIEQRKQLEKPKEVSQKVAEIQKKYAKNQNKMNEELQKVYAENTDEYNHNVISNERYVCIILYRVCSL